MARPVREVWKSSCDGLEVEKVRRQKEQVGSQTREVVAQAGGRACMSWGEDKGRSRGELGRG